MSSSRSKVRSPKNHDSEGGAVFSEPSGWSDWEWSADYQCNFRYQQKPLGDYEFEYGPVQPADGPRNLPPNQNFVPEKYSSYSNYTTSPTGSVDNDVAKASLNLVSIQQTQYSPPLPTSAFYNDNNQCHIKTRDPTTLKESFDPDYRVHRSSEFKWGRVFEVLWSEPNYETTDRNADDSDYSVRNMGSDRIHMKVRRFVIIDQKEGHCICLPITTYSHRGVNKRGVRPEDHAIIWTEKPTLLPGEKGLCKKSIRVKPAKPQHKLHEASRLNYAKPYTVEYNVKVWFIGHVYNDSMVQLAKDYNRMHPPIQPNAMPTSATDADASCRNTSNTHQVTYSTAPVASYPFSTASPPSAKRTLACPQQMPSDDKELYASYSSEADEGIETTTEPVATADRPFYTSSEESNSTAGPGQLQRTPSAGGMAAFGAGMYAAGAATTFMVGAVYVGHVVGPR